MTRTAWLDCSAGVSGDMLLAALTAVGAVDVAAVIAALGLDAACTVSTTTRGGLEATRVEIRVGADQPHRRLDDVLRIIDAADVPEPARARARRVFARLAEAEARVHGVTPQQVEFHEVGAVDAILDVLAACVGLHALGADAVVVSTVSLGGGVARTAHGRLPVPGPAVLELLRATPLPARGGPVDVELATPTGVALLTEWATAVGAMPTMQVGAVGYGAGGRDLAELPNVLRLVVGEGEEASGEWVVLETNVDDLDPRAWPGVLEALLAAGAADAWLAPITMKKGRPAHTLSALTTTGALDGVREVVFRETSAIGVRVGRVQKTALDREWLVVDVGGQPVRVKVARLAGAVVNATPEWEDVARAARALDRPAKDVLADAAAAGHLAIRTGTGSGP